MNKEKCFGEYVITSEKVRPITDGICAALVEKNCYKCKYYKPLEQVIEEFKRTTYPVKK